MIQRLRALAAPIENPGLVPGTNSLTHNHLSSSSKESDARFWPLQGPGTNVVNIHTYGYNTHTERK